MTRLFRTFPGPYGKTVYTVDGERVDRAEYYRRLEELPPPADAGPLVNKKSHAAWPMKSDALGVHPDQVAEANDRNAKNGVNVTYDKDGFAIIPDRNERRKLLKLEGFHDRDGGYGDG